MLDWGWQGVQEFIQGTSPAQQYYSLKYGLFSRQSLTFHPEISVYEVFTSDFTAQLQQFIMMIFVEVKYYWDLHLCINGGWDTEKVYILF